jgi:hypothetical protein
MSKWPMRGHFRYLSFKTFLMTPRTPQLEVFWALLLSSKHSGVPEDSKSPTFPSVGLHPHTWPKWGCDRVELQLPLLGAQAFFRTSKVRAQAKNLNSYHDSYERIIKVEICVTWVMHFHSYLLGCSCRLLTCWLGCHMVSGGKGIIKVCAIWV